MERKLTAVLTAEVVSYSRLMEVDEVRTLAALKAHREGLIDPEIAKYHGICWLEASNKLIETESVEAVSETLISIFLAGLRVSRPDFDVSADITD